MLLNKLYSYKHIAGDTIESLLFEIKINSDSQIFKGHFPGNPITPGVCQMEMVKEIFADFMNTKLQYSTVIDMKFINMWIPDDQEVLKLKLSAKKEEGNYTIKANIANHNLTYFKIRGTVNECI